MYFKFILAILLVAVNSVCVRSQIEIAGKVIDHESKEPLPYASISVIGSAMGTLSNDQGEFVFHVPFGHTQDTLMISHMGYKTRRLALPELQRHPARHFMLDPSPVMLNEAIVSADGARKLVQEAKRAIPLVYPTTPYLMEGFHRSWERIDYTDSVSHPGTLIEAAVTIFDPGYMQKNSKNKTQEEIYVNEIRRSELTEGWNYDKNNLRTLLDKNLVKYNRAAAWIYFKSFLDFPNNLIYEWAGTTQISGDTLSIVKIEVPNIQNIPSYYLIYISDRDHAILRFDLMGAKKEVEYTLGPWHTEIFSESYIFKRYNQKLYLNFINRQYTVKKLDLIRRKILQTETYSMELLINDVLILDVKTKRKSLSGQKSNKNSLALQTKDYHADFWKNYNVILENPLDRAIIKYFERNSKPGTVEKK